MEEKYLEEINNKLQGSVLRTNIYVGELTLDVAAENVLQVCQVLKDEFGFNYFSDLGTVDHFEDEMRFEVFYNLFNLELNRRIRVRVRLPEENPEVESVTRIWPAADWHEREAWDMMGIKFRNHPDLRRMFMPEDFEYFPHRKEFPLIGIPGSLSLPEKDDTQL